jgi:hypothetical protein
MSRRTGKTKPRKLKYDVDVNRALGEAIAQHRRITENGTDVSTLLLERVRWTTKRKP